MKKIISLLTVLAIAITLLSACGAPAEPASTELGQSEKVVILVLDALSSSYLSQLGPTPIWRRSPRTVPVSLMHGASTPPIP